jgi:uncharacterized protein (TIGR03435 family)
MDVLLLKIQKSHAAGLKPQAGDIGFLISKDADDHVRIEGNQSLQYVAPLLEKFLGKPVIDQTGLAQSFSLDLQWKESGADDTNHDALKQALLDQLGLELVPSRAPVEMLVVEKVNN